MARPGLRIKPKGCDPFIHRGAVLPGRVDVRELECALFVAFTVTLTKYITVNFRYKVCIFSHKEARRTLGGSEPGIGCPFVKLVIVTTLLQLALTVV